MANESDFTRGYNSFSGVDIKAVFAGVSIGSLQGISYAVNREKAPIYTMGSADARGFSRGKRGIAGSLIFIQFDREPLLKELANRDDQNNALWFQSDTDDLRPEFASETALENVQGSSVGAVGTSTNEPGATVDRQESNLVNVASDQTLALPWFADQIPPFDVVLAAANEYGALAIMKILGVEILNGGYGVSIDDIVCEHSYTFIATGIVPWATQPVVNRAGKKGAGSGGIQSGGG